MKQAQYENYLSPHLDDVSSGIFPQVFLLTKIIVNFKVYLKL